MEYRKLGNSALLVSRICLGTMTYGSKAWRSWVLTEDEGRAFIKRALDLGINFFDTADMYSTGLSEEILGRAIRDYTQREKVVIATKVFFPMSEDPEDRGLSRKHILDAADKSLRRLGTDSIDLYQIHRFDPDIPVEETLEALNSLVRSGKVRYIGASSMYAYQMAKMLSVSERNGWAKFVSMQNHYNLVYREEEREMIPLCVEEEIGIIPWSPLARGFLTGNRKRGSKGETARARGDTYAHELYTVESDYDIADRVMDVAAKRSTTPARVALAWMLQKPYITAPIIGATKMEHLEDAVAALEVKLSADEIRQLEELYVPHRVLGHF